MKPLETTSETSVTITTIVSGLPFWPSRDPIGISGALCHSIVSGSTWKCKSPSSTVRVQLTCTEHDLFDLAGQLRLIGSKTEGMLQIVEFRLAQIQALRRQLASIAPEESSDAGTYLGLGNNSNLYVDPDGLSLIIIAPIGPRIGYDMLCMANCLLKKAADLDVKGVTATCTICVALIKGKSKCAKWIKYPSCALCIAMIGMPVLECFDECAPNQPSDPIIAGLPSASSSSTQTVGLFPEQ